MDAAYREAARRRDRPDDDRSIDPRRDHRGVGTEGRYVRAVGVADKATGAPMKADFYSRIGSLTKTFTVTGVLQLADQAKLGLDDPIGKYIDGVPQGDMITLRQPARMRSGLENYAKLDGIPAGTRRRPVPQIHTAGTAGLRVR